MRNVQETIEISSLGKDSALQYGPGHDWPFPFFNLGHGLEIFSCSIMLCIGLGRHKNLLCQLTSKLYFDAAEAATKTSTPNACAESSKKPTFYHKQCLEKTSKTSSNSKPKLK